MTTLAAPSPLPLISREKRPRTLVAVVTASLAIHALFFLLIALYLGFISAITPSEPVPESEAPTITLETLLEPFELTKLDPLPEEPAPDSQKKSLRTIRAASKPSEEAAPENATFESDRNQTAASELPASADPTATQDLPSMTGTDKLPGANLEDTDFSETPETPKLAQPESVAQQPQEAQPEVTPTEAQEAQPLPPTRVETAEEFDPIPSDNPVAIAPPLTDVSLDDPRPIDLVDQAEQLLEAIPEVPLPKKPIEQSTPADPRAADSEQRKTETAGTISNPGEAAISSADTPAGRYTKAVNRQVEVLWRRYMRDKRDFAGYSTISVTYSVNAAGEVSDLQILSNDASATITDATLNAILNADIPPIPADVLEVLENGLLYINASFTLY